MAIDLKTGDMNGHGLPSGVIMRVSFRDLVRALKLTKIVAEDETVTHLIADQNGLSLRVELPNKG